MSTSQAMVSVSMVAAADLSAQQFRFVDVDSNGQAAAISAIGQRAVGVLQNKPGEMTSAAGETAQVAISGIVKVEASAAITRGTEVKAAADGRAVDASTEVNNHYCMGVAMSAAGAAGDVIEVLLYTYRQAA